MPQHFRPAQFFLYALKDAAADFNANTSLRIERRKADFNARFQCQYFRSSARYCTASAMCACSISPRPARSAMVLATLTTRV